MAAGNAGCHYVRDAHLLCKEYHSAPAFNIGISLLLQDWQLGTTTGMHNDRCFTRQVVYRTSRRDQLPDQSDGLSCLLCRGEEVAGCRMGVDPARRTVMSGTFGVGQIFRLLKHVL